MNKIYRFNVCKCGHINELPNVGNSKIAIIPPQKCEKCGLIQNDENSDFIVTTVDIRKI